MPWGSKGDGTIPYILLRTSKLSANSRPFSHRWATLPLFKRVSVLPAKMFQALLLMVFWTAKDDLLFINHSLSRVWMSRAVGWDGCRLRCSFHCLNLLNHFFVQAPCVRAMEWASFMRRLQKSSGSSAGKGGDLLMLAIMHACVRSSSMEIAFWGGHLLFLKAKMG